MNWPERCGLDVGPQFDIDEVGVCADHMIGVAHRVSGLPTRDDVGPVEIGELVKGHAREDVGGVVVSAGLGGRDHEVDVPSQVGAGFP